MPGVASGIASDYMSAVSCMQIHVHNSCQLAYKDAAQETYRRSFGAVADGLDAQQMLFAAHRLRSIINGVTPVTELALQMTTLAMRKLIDQGYDFTQTVAISGTPPRRVTMAEYLQDIRAAFQHHHGPQREAFLSSWTRLPDSALKLAA